MRSRSLLLTSGICILLLLHGVFQLWLAKHENQTIDEGVHISAGISYLVTGDFRLNPEHPPLPKMIAALPVLLLHPKLPLDTTSWETAEQWGFAHTFMYESGNDPDAILWYGRMPFILMTIALGWIISRWARDVGGWLGSYVATGIFVTFPIILTHGHLITTDIPVTLFITAGAYMMYRWAKSRAPSALMWSAFYFGVATNMKFTGVMAAFVALLVLTFLVWSKFRNTAATTHPIRNWFWVTALVTIALALITTRGITKSFVQDPYHGLRRIQQVEDAMRVKTGIVHGLLSAYRIVLFKVPIPAYPYVNGLSMFIDHTEGGHESYFLGNYTDMGSVWYFPVALIIKSPLSMIICITLLFVVFVKKSFLTFRYMVLQVSFWEKIRGWLQSFSDAGFILAAFPILYLLISMTSKVNIGVRHILPIFPFIIIGIGSLFSLKLKRQRIFSLLLIALLLLNLVTIIWVYPFPMAYFSEVVGGANNGHKYLLDSNLDWGQNLKYLKTYMTQQHIPYVCYSYFGQGNPQYEGIPGANLPITTDILGRNALNCVVAISAQSLYSRDNAYSWLRIYRPTTVIGYGIYIFDFRK